MLSETARLASFKTLDCRCQLRNYRMTDLIVTVRDIYSVHGRTSTPEAQSANRKRDEETPQFGIAHKAHSGVAKETPGSGEKWWVSMLLLEIPHRRFL